MKKHIFWHNFYHFFSNVAEKAVIFSDGEYRYKLWNSLSKDKDGYEKNEIFMKNYIGIWIEWLIIHTQIT